MTFISAKQWMFGLLAIFSYATHIPLIPDRRNQFFQGDSSSAMEHLMRTFPSDIDKIFSYS